MKLRNAPTKAQSNAKMHIRTNGRQEFAPSESDGGEIVVVSIGVDYC
jgi:hypothetical protein